MSDDGRMDEIDGPPGPRLPDDEEAEIKRIGEEVRRLHREMNPTPVIGYATEHSIEDPFTGDVTVTIRLI